MNIINNNLTSAPRSAASPQPHAGLLPPPSRRPAIMGILNVTEDSFYDGGRYLTEEDVLAQARKLLSEGADIIDLGVVSSRPGAKLLAPQEEADKLAPWVALLRKELPKGTPISVDTCFSLPAAKAVEAGADIINDISGGQFDPQMFPTVASLKVRYILMHTKGTPDTMQRPENTRYDDIISDLSDYFAEKLEKLDHLGVKEVWLDPGFGFAKTVEQNYEILYRLPELIAQFPQHPMLVALSNKSMITQQLTAQGIDPFSVTEPLPDSEYGTLALNALAIERGASILRVHTPRPTLIAATLLSSTPIKPTPKTP